MSDGYFATHDRVRSSAVAEYFLKLCERREGRQKTKFVKVSGKGATLPTIIGNLALSSSHDTHIWAAGEARRHASGERNPGAFIDAEIRRVGGDRDLRGADPARVARDLRADTDAAATRVVVRRMDGAAAASRQADLRAAAAALPEGFVRLLIREYERAVAGARGPYESGPRALRVGAVDRVLDVVADHVGSASAREQLDLTLAWLSTEKGEAADDDYVTFEDLLLLIAQTPALAEDVRLVDWTSTGRKRRGTSKSWGVDEARRQVMSKRSGPGLGWVPAAVDEMPED